MTRWPLLALLVLLLGGCADVSSAVFQQGRSPTCESRGQSGTPVVILEAQAVPSATLLPCVKLLPSGWRVSDVFIHNGRARFALDSDRAGPHAVTVVLERYCQLPGVTRVPSDEPGTRRYEQIGPLRAGVGFTGTRFYLFPGGCVSYRFSFRGEERAEPIGEVTLAISFVTRDAVREHIREDTGGRAELDPAPVPAASQQGSHALPMAQEVMSGDRVARLAARAVGQRDRASLALHRRRLPGGAVQGS